MLVYWVFGAMGTLAPPSSDLMHQVGQDQLALVVLKKSAKGIVILEARGLQYHLSRPVDFR